VTASFVTNVIELTQDALMTISGNLGEEVPAVTLRFFKPSKSFYNRLMNQWFRMLPRLRKMAPANRSGFARPLLIRSFGDSWKEEFTKPLDFFLNVLLSEEQ